jgi:hypothetical protein
LLLLNKADSIKNLENLTLDEIEFYGKIWEKENERLAKEYKGIANQRT